MSIWENILFLFSGWLLGLLSAIILDERKRRRDKRMIAQGLKIELREVKYKLAMTAWFLAFRFGGYDREFLQWLKPIADDYKGLNPRDNIRRLIDSHLALTDDQLVAAAAHGQQESAGGLSMKSIQLPFLEAKIEHIATFDEAFQRVALETRAQMGHLNEDMELARFYFEKSFDSLSKTNHENVCKNLENTYRNIGAKARQIVNLIAKFPTV